MTGASGMSGPNLGLVTVYFSSDPRSGYQLVADQRGSAIVEEHD